MLFPIDEDVVRLAHQTPLRWVTEFRYLGGQVNKTLSAYLDKNLVPLLADMKARFSSWANLLLNLLGKINRIKVMGLPKFTYIFRNAPCLVPGRFFRAVDRCLGSFLWGGAWFRGWLNLHCGSQLLWEGWPCLIFGSTTGRRSLSLSPNLNAPTCLEAAFLGSFADLKNVAYRGPRAYGFVPGPSYLEGVSSG